MGPLVSIQLVINWHSSRSLFGTDQMLDCSRKVWRKIVLDLCYPSLFDASSCDFRTL